MRSCGDYCQHETRKVSILTAPFAASKGAHLAGLVGVTLTQRNIRFARFARKRFQYTTAQAIILAFALTCFGCYGCVLVLDRWSPELPFVSDWVAEILGTAPAAPPRRAIRTPIPPLVSQPLPAPRPLLTPQISEPLPAPLSTATKTPMPTFTPGPADPLQMFRASDEFINHAKDEALRIISYNLMDGDKPQGPPRAHSAGPGYDAPWIRDSFAWGMIPFDVYPQLIPYTNSEIRYWLNTQRNNGQLATVLLSGYYDETSIMISAVLEAYLITGDKRALAERAPALRRAWAWLRGYVNSQQSQRLIYVPLILQSALPNEPPVAADWADQVARRGFAGQVNMLWYRATQSMALMEATLGNATAAEQYRQFAAGIKSDINRILWTTQAPHARNAPAVGEFGHYRSWIPADRDYFELDTNMQAIVYGIADTSQTTSIISFIRDHADYLLGPQQGAPPPAKTVYGDYDPRDYALVQHKLRDGEYHNAYWLPIGSLAARAFARANQHDLTQRTIVGMASAFQGQLADARMGSAYEWYGANGKGGGVPAYQWSARTFLHALYRAYLGVEPDWEGRTVENLRVNPTVGGLTARLKHLGKHLTIRTHGEGAYRYAIINGRTEIRGNVIPANLLTDGGILDLYLGQ